VTTARQTIVSYKENSNNGFVLCLNEDGSSGFPRIWVNATPGGWLFNESPAVLPAGWNHLAASYDGGNIRLYINGIEHLPATAAPGVMTNSASDTMAIGARNSVNLHWFPGLIDDVRVYGRALTATEVQVLAAGTPAPMTLTATAGLNQVMLGWSAPAGPAATYSYTVKRRDSGFGNYVALNTVSVLSYTDTTAVGGTPYDYVVTAISAAESGPSSSVTVTPTSPAPPTPLGGKGDASCGSGVADAPGPFFMMLLIPALGLLMLPSSWLALVRRRRG
jgi:hypothetical protein